MRRIDRDLLEPNLSHLGILTSLAVSLAPLELDAVGGGASSFFWFPLKPGGAGRSTACSRTADARGAGKSEPGDVSTRTKSVQTDFSGGEHSDRGSALQRGKKGTEEPTRTVKPVVDKSEA